MIDFVYKAEPTQIYNTTITYRKLKSIEAQSFCEDISNALASCTSDVLGDKVNHYNKSLREILDKHAPIKTKEIRILPNAPWFDEEYAELRRQRRKAEKRYMKSKSTEHKAQYQLLRLQTKELALKKKKSFVTKKLEASQNKSLYSVVNSLLDNNRETVLPTAKSDQELANSFRTYFSEKIEKIRKALPQAIDDHTQRDLPPNVTPLAVFEPTDADEVRQIVKSFPIKCSSDDPLPASVVSENTELLIPFWVDIVNLSLESGSLQNLKKAIIIPLIKQIGSKVDKEIYKNYRPLSNLQFLSKLIERVVDRRLDKHLSRNNLHAPHQFGCKTNYSTEALLMKIVDKLMIQGDKGYASIVLLLDLSAAFNTVDHKKMLDILQYDCGVTGVALKWFESFLIDRSFVIKVGGSHSVESVLHYGVPQGSVLGPKLFNIYARSIIKEVDATKFEIEGYVDDHQLLKHFVPTFQNQVLAADIQDCMEVIGKWMNSHFLKLNQDKTMILVVIPPALRKEIVIKGVFLNSECIRFVESAKNLGFVLDSCLTFEPQVKKVVQGCFLMIRKLYSVKQFFTIDQLKQLVCSKVLSIIDYCNVLYYGISAPTMKKLQHVQNSAARLIIGKGGQSSLDDFFLESHWLKVRERILYKIILMVHKCIQLKAPQSLSGLLRFGDSGRTMKLQELRVSTKLGSRAFSHVGPKLWNCLPAHIRNEHDTDIFKKILKSYLLINASTLQARFTAC